jgi:hypothetical protein
LASAHYSAVCLEKLRILGIPLVPKDENPPNVPQMRLIEDLWANIKRKVYANNFKDKNAAQLIRRIKNILKNLDPSIFTGPMRRVLINVHKASKYGPDILIH